jgi:hypothetical protein
MMGTRPMLVFGVHHVLDDDFVALWKSFFWVALPWLRAPFLFTRLIIPRGQLYWMDRLCQARVRAILDRSDDQG